MMRAPPCRYNDEDISYPVATRERQGRGVGRRHSYNDEDISYPVATLRPWSSGDAPTLQW